MRISDWSSDVCSSDLQSSGGSSPRHRLCEQHAFHPSSFSASVLTKVKWNCVPPPCAGSIQMRPPLASTIVRQIERPSPLPSALVPTNALQSWAAQSDRNGVGSGKRVSVRVDLGGRRNK